MEFKTLRNIENSFRQIRLYAIVFAVLCIGVVGYAVWRSYRFAEEQRQKIYVLDNGKSLMLALSQDASINRPVEAREHVRRFHELFFTLAPDKNAIESNMSRAFNLADKSAFDYYKDLSERAITAGLFRVTYSSVLRLIVSFATSTTILMPCAPMPNSSLSGQAM